MQTTANGEYIPSKELDMNFKIPKTNQQQQQQQQVEQQPQQQQQQLYYPVLDNSYYAYQPEMAHYQYQYQYDPSQNVFMKLLEYKTAGEKPKNQSDQIMRDTIPDYFDETLPKELVGLFQPLYCKLCSAQLSSNIVARLHYKSKNHEKKIRKFLIDYSERTGEPLHKRARLSIKQQYSNNNSSDNIDNNNTNDNPLYYYCDICDLSLTGKLHAESHYMGKNHKKALLGLKNPAGKGHYDANGKWIREKQTKSSTTVGDNFGEAFRTQQQPQQQPLIGPILEKPSTSTQQQPQPPQPQQQQKHQTNSNYFCELCNITTTCQEQLECHYKGQKHLKKLKRLNPDATIIINPENNKICEIWNGDCSVYRTPSGSFYCPICNLSLNVEQQFKQHMISKNHMKKVAAQKN